MFSSVEKTKIEQESKDETNRLTTIKDDGLESTTKIFNKFDLSGMTVLEEPNVEIEKPWSDWKKELMLSSSLCGSLSTELLDQASREEAKQENNEIVDDDLVENLTRRLS